MMPHRQKIKLFGFIVPGLAPVAGAVLLLGLAACSGDDRPPPPCPQIVVLKDAAQQVKFVGAGRDLTDVVFEAMIEGQGIACEYDEDEVEVDMRVRLTVARGPADTRQQADLNYFVAIARRDRSVLARESFDLVVPLPGNQTRVRAVEEIAPVIPLGAQETGQDYRIYVGLSLSDEELAYNRANK